VGNEEENVSDASHGGWRRTTFCALCVSRVKENARGAHNEKKGDEDSEIAWSTRRAIVMASRNALERALRRVTALFDDEGR
jgi:hypothetical protein